MNFHKFIRDGEGWELLKADEQFANPHIEIYAVETRTPSRPEGVHWTVAHRKGAVVVAPQTADGSFLLVHQERVPVRATLWEFPAGQIDESTEHDDAAIRATALRELGEESGYELAPGGDLIPLGLFFPSAGFTDEHSHLFLAKPVVPSGRGTQFDANEAITECRAFTAPEFRRMIAENEIRDANTLSAFARLVALGLM
jgi:8-oxo-dGTP pyrophosphatase MutT (NUDIX family)